ncbi:class I SAM-dependent methyltransferase [Methanocalculus taiwanensis]|uniref:Class I SAM-dependent methyltransferase n=1 Tax=Methanocalculus taiwanensis TaxID=106207 RepID=A0ABD4THD5_9EURY|nr:class I SAM-dependent methyltransferase [Methanocalculus taiwanensis]MCQ1538131.1 class I SAM-dependent methyltransferase [Methanocalculus taiwanensis]
MNPLQQAFTDHADDYDRWFDDHPKIYSAQLSILRDAVPAEGLMLEIGVGSGRFAAPLCITLGIDPSHSLAKIAKRRGIETVIGVGEHTPFRDNTCDAILMMTVICFLDDPLPVFWEAHRLLKPDGTLVLGFIEKDGEIARRYQGEKVKGRFLRYVTYYSVDEIAAFFQDAGFLEVAIAHRRKGFTIMTGKKR